MLLFIAVLPRQSGSLPFLQFGEGTWLSSFADLYSGSVIGFVSTCTHAGCTCDNFREELMGAPDMRLNGNCINCDHPVNAYPRQPAHAIAGNNTVLIYRWWYEHTKWMGHIYIYNSSSDEYIHSSSVECEHSKINAAIAIRKLVSTYIQFVFRIIFRIFILRKWLLLTVSCLLKYKECIA